MQANRKRVTNRVWWAVVASRAKKALPRGSVWPRIMAETPWSHGRMGCDHPAGDGGFITKEFLFFLSHGQSCSFVHVFLPQGGATSKGLSRRDKPAGSQTPSPSALVQTVQAQGGSSACPP